jgi:KDO2-lipid IV(A) lauroyltransferase
VRRAESVRVNARWHAGPFNNGVIFGATYQGVTRLPRWCSYGIGHVGTWIAYHLMRSGTRALIDNFSIVRPSADAGELEALALRTYRSYARDTIDFIRTLHMGPEQLQSIVARHDVGPLADLLSDGRGVILVGGHFGNWELGGIALRVLENCPVTVVGRPEPSPAVGELRRRMRERFGIESVEIGNTLDTALALRRLLAAPAVVAMLIDRHVGRDRIDVNFFGRPTPFLRTPALIASLSRVPMLPASMIRQPDGRFVGWFGKAVYVDSKHAGEEGLREATAAVAAQLETQIREHPELWYQFYPYWTRPPELELKI